MKPETKLAIERWALRLLRTLVWRLDEWIHKRELELRPPDALEQSIERPDLASYSMANPFPSQVERACRMQRVQPLGSVTRVRPATGLIVTDGCKTPGKTAPLNTLSRRPRRRGISAAEFDLRFAR
jgi:hypothetical protein